MIRTSIWMGLVLIACGGSATPEPRTADDSAPAAEHEEKASAGSKSSDDAKGDDSKSDDSKSDGAKSTGGATDDAMKASGDVVQTVLQLVIEDAELDKYLRLGEPGRFPLKIAGKDIPSSIALTKAGQPVKVLEGEPAKKDAALVFTKVDISPPEATVSYRFDIEGIVGTAHLKKASYGWELKSSRIVEHYRADSK